MYDCCIKTGWKSLLLTFINKCVILQSEIRVWNTLRLDRFTSPGAYLEDEEGNDVLLPTKYIDPAFKLDDMVDVFLYKDTEGRIIATTLKPYLTLNQFGVLRIAEVNQFGAFAEWGVEKHLLIPFREQPKKLEEGKYYLIYLYLDEATQRLAGTTRTKMYLSTVEEGDEIEKIKLLNYSFANPRI